MGFIASERVKSAELSILFDVVEIRVSTVYTLLDLIMTASVRRE